MKGSGFFLFLEQYTVQLKRETSYARPVSRVCLENAAVSSLSMKYGFARFAVCYVDQ
jgi:hypothetical protein